jgi:hypothetical protein
MRFGRSRRREGMPGEWIRGLLLFPFGKGVEMERDGN